jgi:hypothetical protein
MSNIISAFRATGICPFNRMFVKENPLKFAISSSFKANRTTNGNPKVNAIGERISAPKELNKQERIEKLITLENDKKKELKDKEDKRNERKKKSEIKNIVKEEKKQKKNSLVDAEKDVIQALFDNGCWKEIDKSPTITSMKIFMNQLGIHMKAGWKRIDYLNAIRIFLKKPKDTDRVITQRPARKASDGVKAIVMSQQELEEEFSHS